MERWDGTVLDINATCIKLGSKCLQLLAMHALSGCDTASYPYGKGKITAINTLLNGDFQGLAVLGEVGVSETELIEAAMPFFLRLYGQKTVVSLESARFKLFTKNKTNAKVMSLPPTYSNFLQHVLRCHLQVMLWKAANQSAPPIESTDLSHFGWELKDNIPCPVVSRDHPAPPELIDIISCQCKAQLKKCSSVACGCHKAQLSCTSYCSCSGEDGCCNPYTQLCQSQSAENTGHTDTTDDTQIEGDLEDENSGDCDASDSGDSDLDW
jgi:hypothetical protein